MSVTGQMRYPEISVRGCWRQSSEGRRRAAAPLIRQTKSATSRLAAIAVFGTRQKPHAAKRRGCGNSSFALSAPGGAKPEFPRGGEGYKVFLSFDAALVGDALDKVFLAVEEEQQRGDHIHARHCEGETDLTGIDVGQKHRKRLGVGVL